MSDEVSNAVLAQILKGHGELLTEIKADVKAQNGRVNALEKDVIRIKAFWSAGVIGVAAVWPYVKGKLGIP